MLLRSTSLSSASVEPAALSCESKLLDRFIHIIWRYEAHLSIFLSAGLWMGECQRGDSGGPESSEEWPGRGGGGREVGGQAPRTRHRTDQPESGGALAGNGGGEEQTSQQDSGGRGRATHSSRRTGNFDIYLAKFKKNTFKGAE